MTPVAIEQMDDGELDVARRELEARVRGIEVQLGQTRRYREDGTEYSRTEFDQWRQGAKYAREQMLKEYRLLKAEVKRRNVERGGSNTFVDLGEKLDETNRLLARIVELLEMDE